MKDLLRHTHASLLRFIADQSAKLTTLTGSDFKPVNMDAVLDENELPTENILGLEDFAYSDSDDPVAIVSGAFVVGTSNDPNAMIRINALSKMVDDTKALTIIPLLHADTGENIGELIFKGHRRVLPKINGEIKTYQPVTFDAGVQFNV